MVNKETHICIEGFPRSANTFAVVAFSQAQNKSCNIAHHLHAIAQLKLVKYYSVPSIIIVRDPLSCVCSLIVRDSRISPRQALEDYIRFYNYVKKNKNYFVVCSFEEVINNLAKVTQKVNVKYNKKFDIFTKTPEKIAEINTIIERLDARYNNREKFDEKTVSRPSKTRIEISKKVKNLIIHDYAVLLIEANKIYKIVTQCDAH